MNTELKVSLVQDIKLFDYKFNFSSFLTKLNLLSLFLYWKRDNLRVPKKYKKRAKKTLQITRHRMDTSALRCKVKFCL